MDDGTFSQWGLFGLIALALTRFLVNLMRSGYHGLGTIYQRALAERQKADRPALATALEQPQRLESQMQIADTLGLIVMVSLFSWVFPIGFWMSLVVLGCYIVIFDALLPVYLARHHPEAFVLRLFPVLRWLFTPLHPFGVIAQGLAHIGARYEEKISEDDEESPEEINAFIEAGAEEGLIEDKQRKLIQNILNIDETLAREIMTPRTDLRCVPIDMPRIDVLDVFKDCHFSRLPVYRKDFDSIEGMLRLKDLVNQSEAPIADLVMPVLYIHEDVNVVDLLEQMLETRIQMAIVLDQYSGTSGLITLEDVIEEIVGEIHDEHESPESDEVIQQEDGSYLIDGRLNLDDFQRLLGVTIQNEDVDTIGGHIFTTLGRIPEVGTQVDLAGTTAEIIRADERRIYQLRIAPVVGETIESPADS